MKEIKTKHAFCRWIMKRKRKLIRKSWTESINVSHVCFVRLKNCRPLSMRCHPCSCKNHPDVVSNFEQLYWVHIKVYRLEKYSHDQLLTMDVREQLPLTIADSDRHTSFDGWDLSLIQKLPTKTSRERYKDLFEFVRLVEVNPVIRWTEDNRLKIEKIDSKMQSLIDVT